MRERERIRACRPRWRRSLLTHSHFPSSSSVFLGSENATEGWLHCTHDENANLRSLEGRERRRKQDRCIFHGGRGGGKTDAFRSPTMPRKITHILLFYTFQLLSSEPRRFRSLVEESLRRHVAAVNELADAGELEIPEKN